MHGITIIGPGRLGGALAVAISLAGEHVDALVYRERRPAKRLLESLGNGVEVIKFDKLTRINSPIVIVAIQDEELSHILDALQGSTGPETVVLHTSGSISSEIFEPLRTKDRCVGSIHPLASITSWEDGVSGFHNAYFGIKGDPKAVAAARRLAIKLGGRPFALNSQKKALYHAAAVMAAGHVTALFDVAVRLMVESGVSRPQSRKLLQPLLAGVAQNLRTKDTAAALTGTFARGDISTFERHLAAVSGVTTENELNIYLDLAERSIEISERAGLDRDTAATMREMIRIAKARKR